MARPTKWTKEKVEKLADELDKHFENARLEFISNPKGRYLPFISQFCRDVGKLSRETLNVKSKENKKLSDALKRAKQIQKEILIQGGLEGRFNPTAFIFTAKNITDMRDKQELEHSGKGKVFEINIKTTDENRLGTDKKTKPGVGKAS